MVWTYRSLTIYLLKDIFCFLRFLALTNKAATNFTCRFYVNISFYFSGMNAQEYNCWVYGVYMVYVCCDFCHIPTSDGWVSDPISLHPRQHLVLWVFFILVILVGVWQYRTISLMVLIFVKSGKIPKSAASVPTLQKCQTQVAWLWSVTSEAGSLEQPIMKCGI